MSVKLPESLPRTDEVLYESRNSVIVLNCEEYQHKGTVELMMDVGPHHSHPDIVPDEIFACDIYDEKEDVSTVSELPDEYYSKFMRVIEQLETEYNLQRQYTNEGHGTCIHCSCSEGSIGNDLTFVTYLTEE